MNALLDAIAHATPSTEAQRLFHGRGGRFPGCEDWLLDWYAPVWLLTKFGEASAEEQAVLTQALQARQQQLAPDQPLNAVLQSRVAGGSHTQVLAGTVPEPHVVREDGASYRVNLLRGQNHGLFLDMAEGRRWVRANAKQARVLNLFAYTCSFSVAALLGGAKSVVNIDMAHPALATGLGDRRPTELSERQLRGGQRLATPLATLARFAAPGWTGLALFERPRIARIVFARSARQRSARAGGGTTPAQPRGVRRHLARPGAEGLGGAAAGFG